MSVAIFVFFFFFFWVEKEKGERSSCNPLDLLSSQAETGGCKQSARDSTLGVRMQTFGIPMTSVSRDLFVS